MPNAPQPLNPKPSREQFIRKPSILTTSLVRHLHATTILRVHVLQAAAQVLFAKTKVHQAWTFGASGHFGTLGHLAALAILSRSCCCRRVALPWPLLRRTWESLTSMQSEPGGEERQSEGHQHWFATEPSLHGSLSTASPERAKTGPEEKG